MTRLRQLIQQARARLESLQKRLAELRRLRRIYRILGDHGKVIYEEAKRADLDLALARALVEQESGNRNVFGCDLGPRSSAPWCHQVVTKERVQALIRHIHGGGTSNGVGLTQLTSIGFIEQAERAGGAHVPRYQCRVGFQLLAGLIRQLGTFKGIGAYNGGPGNPIDSYARSVLAKRDAWRQRLT